MGNSKRCCTTYGEVARSTEYGVHSRAGHGEQSTENGGRRTEKGREEALFSSSMSCTPYLAVIAVELHEKRHLDGHVQLRLFVSEVAVRGALRKGTWVGRGGRERILRTRTGETIQQRTSRRTCDIHSIRRAGREMPRRQTEPKDDGAVRMKKTRSWGFMMNGGKSFMAGNRKLCRMGRNSSNRTLTGVSLVT